MNKKNNNIIDLYIIRLTFTVIKNFLLFRLIRIIFKSESETTINIETNYFLYCAILSVVPQELGWNLLDIESQTVGDESTSFDTADKSVVSKICFK